MYSHPWYNWLLMLIGKHKNMLNIIEIINAQQQILGGFFKGFIMNKYKSYNVMGINLITYIII